MWRLILPLRIRRARHSQDDVCGDHGGGGHGEQGDTGDDEAAEQPTTEPGRLAALMEGATSGQGIRLDQKYNKIREVNICINMRYSISYQSAASVSLDSCLERRVGTDCSQDGINLLSAETLVATAMHTLE